MVVTEVKSCRICGSPDLLLVLDLGAQVPAGYFPAADEADPPAVPLLLVRCHLEAPMNFVSDIQRILHPYGIWVMEQSYMPTMLRMTAFDTICHEHLEYYGLDQIRRMLERHRLKILTIEFGIMNGGSFKVTAAATQGEPWANRPGLPQRARRKARYLAALPQVRAENPRYQTGAMRVAKGRKG